MKRLTALLLTCALFAAALTACAHHGADSASGSAASSPLSQDALAQPTYPKLASYPNEKDYVKANGDFDSDGFQAAYDAWQADQQKQQNQSKDYQDGLNQFCASHLSAFFQGEQKDNQVCSPLNLSLIHIWFQIQLKYSISCSFGKEKPGFPPFHCTGRKSVLH